MLNGLLDVMLNGLLDLSFWGYVIAALLFTHITIAGVTIYLHRHQAHRALELHPVVSHLFRFWLWMSTGMVTGEWVAVHRKHHAKCETVEDPHSPQVKGIKKVLFEGAELYRQEADNVETLAKYSQGTPNDWLERHIYAPHPTLGNLTMLLIDLSLFGAAGITIWAIQMMWIPIWAAGVVNGVGHYLGYRNFETDDASRNIVPWGIVIGGEELHNNHHAYASSARLSNKPWEFDIGWFYIKTLAILKLATVKKVAPKTAIIPGKQLVDMETVRAIVRNRFHVMKLYGKNVIQPVFREEWPLTSESGKKLMRYSRTLLIREDIKIDDNAKDTLDKVLNQSHALETVYHFKQRLKELCLRSNAAQSVRVQRLQDWCLEAEQTGIAVLQDFAKSLRGYSLQSV